ncbi:flavodoxin family protein [Microvirga pudoricolor]|uniref:flavodoxin family protein n=1 Tax=Microvirga pudoricolor TaxID=2778729 RepID=UPI001E5E7167|nr:flavodoxin family protein [Microvirga pudoricolor]
MPDPTLSESEFRARFLSQFQDPAFESLKEELYRISTAAWDGYSHHRKSPRTRKAGPGFADPDYDLAVDWIAAHEAIRKAQERHEDKASPNSVLLINGSARNEHTCPGEMSKSYRLVQIAKAALSEQGDVEVEVLDLSRLTAEYGREIHPCKSCFSTSAALCHWPCSCYPNYSLGQTHDWMNDIYPLWVRAHGIMIVTPVNWYQATSLLKLMIDRLVCADGGNPDPTSTQGKKAQLAKELELAGWPYPRHLSGRQFAVVTHGDSAGAESLRRNLVDWLQDMELESAGDLAEVDRYIGYWKPYATSHEELDADKAVQEEVANAARTLREAVIAKRSGRMTSAGSNLRELRQK